MAHSSAPVPLRPFPSRGRREPSVAPAFGALAAPRAERLTEFARACRAAVRAVSLYPGEHPAVDACVARLAAAAGRLVAGGPLALTVYPRVLAIAGCTPVRPDRALDELAELLHARLVGTLQIEPGADGDDWRALLLLLARPPEELMGGGGIARTWAGTGRGGFTIREIDYADVLRERGGVEAAWDRVIARCLQGDAAALDEDTVQALLDALQSAARFGELLSRLQQAADAAGATLDARVAALMQLLQAAVDAAGLEATDSVSGALQTMADATAQLTPEMLLAVLEHRRAGQGDAARLASQIVDRVSDDTVATFVARSVVAAHGATERLAQAFEALVPGRDRKERLLDAARDRARATELGADARFEELWQDASRMLLSYCDAPFVSDAYARELTAARTQAIEVERVSDDPPERIRGWLASISDGAVRELDRQLLLDLLRIKTDPAAWEGLASLAATEAERRLVLGEIRDAQQLVEQLAVERDTGGREGLRRAADMVLTRLAAGPLARHVALLLRTTDDASLEPITHTCLLIGPCLMRPLAEALATEEHARAIRRLRELLLAFGAAGRPSVEQLKHSTNPAVRRTAIDLLRVFGGHEALPELASMLHDADPHVQRESVRAIVQIGTADAYEVLERALVDPAVARETLIQQLIGLRDRKAIPPLCGVLAKTRPRGRLARLHRDVLDALGGLGDHPDAIVALRAALHGGDWWAPWRTAGLRRAAAVALRRIGSPAALAVLVAAAADDSRSVRRAARTQMAPPVPHGELP